MMDPWNVEVKGNTMPMVYS